MQQFCLDFAIVVAPSHWHTMTDYLFLAQDPCWLQLFCVYFSPSGQSSSCYLWWAILMVERGKGEVKKSRKDSQTFYSEPYIPLTFCWPRQLTWLGLSSGKISFHHTSLHTAMFILSLMATFMERRTGDSNEIYQTIPPPSTNQWPQLLLPRSSRCENSKFWPKANTFIVSVL